MPRQGRVDVPGALHHVIARGIARKRIFDDNKDRERFLDRLGMLLHETGTRCFAWVLIPNHFHLLLRTGLFPVATVMRRLLTGYAVTYNRRHRRCGHLFQNRYKSILCQEDSYFLELVRYIHLNPLRAKMVSDLCGLAKYRFCGHGVLLGKINKDWQETEYVLEHFGKRLSSARRAYLEFVERGVSEGRNDILTGGGLIRSVGGWSAFKSLRSSKAYMKGDERILGDSDFVCRVLSKADESLGQKSRLESRGIDVDKVAERVSELLKITVDEVWGAGKYRSVVKARSLLCYWSVRELGVTMTSLSKRLGITPAAVGQSVVRGEHIAREEGFSLSP